MFQKYAIILTIVVHVEYVHWVVDEKSDAAE